MKTLLVFLTVCLAVTFTTAQQKHAKHTELPALSELLEIQDPENISEDHYENLNQLLSQPININTATADELRMLLVLGEHQVNRFIEYRKQNGELLSLYELQVIPGFDQATINALLPFITIPDPHDKLNTSVLERLIDYGNIYLLTRFERTLEKRDGFTLTDPHKRFQGSADQLCIRFRADNPGDISLGFIAEKDSGEKIKWSPGNQYFGFDHYSMHLQIRNKGILQNLIIGDFKTQFGQGIMAGGAPGFGKSTETVNGTRKSNIGFLPGTSTNETSYQRGIAGTIRASKHVAMSAFGSIALRDAKLPESDNGDPALSPGTGLHRNAAELEKRKNARENHFGIILNYKRSRFDAGVLLDRIQFRAPVNREANLYNQFSFSGYASNAATAFLNVAFRNISLFSEVARSQGGGTGFIGGALISLSPGLDISLLFRKYDTHLVTFYSGAFSENSEPRNETGVYWGWKYRINRKYRLSGYTDLFRFPWLAFRRYAPAVGHEWMTRIDYEPRRDVLLFLQAREESKPRNTSDETTLYPVVNGIKRNYTLAVQYRYLNLRFKTRLQRSTYTIGQTTTGGIALMFDTSWKTGTFKITSHYALFDTDDIDNRQYIYENDVWLAGSFPAYAGKGIRNYLLLEYAFSKRFRIWVRYAHTRYIQQENIGSGVDRIAGNSKNDIKFQALIKL